MLVFGPVALALFVLVAMTAPPRPATTDTQAAQTTTAPESPAYKLALYDASYAPDTTTVAKYQSELDALKALCTEDEATLASEIWASWKDLESNKVTDETNLSLMAHIAQSVPSSAAPTDCRGVMAAYLVMREPAK